MFPARGGAALRPGALQGRAQRHRQPQARALLAGGRPSGPRAAAGGCTPPPLALQGQGPGRRASGPEALASPRRGSHALPGRRRPQEAHLGVQSERPLSRNAAQGHAQGAGGAQEAHKAALPRGPRRGAERRARVHSSHQSRLRRGPRACCRGTRTGECSLGGLAPRLCSPEGHAPDLEPQTRDPRGPARIRAPAEHPERLRRDPLQTHRPGRAPPAGAACARRVSAATRLGQPENRMGIRALERKRAGPPGGLPRLRARRAPRGGPRHMHTCRCPPGRSVAGTARENPPNEGVAAAHVLHRQRRRLLHLQPGLQQARQAGRRFRVAHHGLHGGHGHHAVRARPAALQHHLRRGPYLNGVSQRSARAVQLQAGHAARASTGVPQGGRDDRLLGRAARGRQRARPAVLVCGGAAHHQRPGPARRRQALRARAPSTVAQHQALARLAAHVTVRCGVERLAPGIPRQHASQLRHPGRLAQQGQVHPRRQARAPAQPQALPRQVQAHQRSRAGSVHAHRLSAEPVRVREPPGHDAKSHARRHPGALGRLVPHHEVVVFHLLHPDVGPSPLEGGLRQPCGARGALQGFPRNLEEHPLLRVHQGRLCRGRPEGRPIKHAHGRQHRRHAQTGLLQRAPALQELHQPVQLVRVPAPPGDAGHGVLVRRRGPASRGRQLRRRAEHCGHLGLSRPPRPRLPPHLERGRRAVRRLGPPAAGGAPRAPRRPRQLGHHVPREGSHRRVVQHRCGVQVETKLPPHGVAQLHDAQRVEPLLHEGGVDRDVLAEQRPRQPLQLRLHSGRLQRPGSFVGPPGPRLGRRRRRAPDELAEELRDAPGAPGRCDERVPVGAARGAHHGGLFASPPHGHPLQRSQPHCRSHGAKVNPQSLHACCGSPAAGHSDGAPHAPLHARARRARRLPRPPQQVQTRVGGRVAGLAHRARERSYGGEQHRNVQSLGLQGGRGPAQGPGLRLAPGSDAQPRHVLHPQGPVAQHARGVHHACDRATHAPHSPLRPHRAVLRQARVSARKAGHAVPPLEPPHGRTHVRAHAPAAPHEQHGAPGRSRQRRRAPAADQHAHAAEPPNHRQGAGFGAHRIPRGLCPAGRGGNPRPHAPQNGPQPQARGPPGAESSHSPGPRVALLARSAHSAHGAHSGLRPGPQHLRKGAASRGLGLLAEAQPHRRARFQGRRLRECRNDCAGEHAGARSASRAARPQPGTRASRPAALPLQRQSQLQPRAAPLKGLQGGQGRGARPHAAGNASPAAPRPAPGRQGRLRSRAGQRGQPSRAVGMRHAALHLRRLRAARCAARRPRHRADADAPSQRHRLSRLPVFDIYGWESRCGRSLRADAEC